MRRVTRHVRGCHTIGAIRSANLHTVNGRPPEEGQSMSSKRVPVCASTGVVAAGWIAVLLLTALARSAFAQEAADCLGCHGEKDLTTERN